MEDRFCVRIDFFKAVLSYPNSAPFFMFPADRRGGGAPRPGQSAGKHNKGEKSMKKRIASILMAIVMAFILLPTVAFADRAPDYISECGTTGIEEGTKHYLAEENLSGNGWDWDAKTGTLTSNNFTGYAINFGTYYGKKIVLAEGSVNTIWHLWLKPNSNGIVIEGSGQLSIKSIFNIHMMDQLQ